MSSMKTEIALGMQGHTEGAEGTWEPIDTAPKDGSWITARYGFTIPSDPFKVRWRRGFWRNSDGLVRGPDTWLKPKTTDTPEAIKHDQGKPRLSLLLTHLSPSLKAMTKVLEYAREKYPSIDNYQGHGSQIPERYLSAALRHLDARASGEIKDPESGCDHLAHAMVSLGFVIWWDSQEEPNDA